MLGVSLPEVVVVGSIRLLDPTAAQLENSNG